MVLNNGLGTQLKMRGTLGIHIPFVVTHGTAAVQDLFHKLTFMMQKSEGLSIPRTSQELPESCGKHSTNQEGSLMAIEANIKKFVS